LWRLPFTKDTPSRIVSQNNPASDMTNSDLELAGRILQQDVLGQHADIASETAHTFCDNTPAVFWRRKESITGTKATSRLLLTDAILRRQQQCVHQIEHISGDDNGMADDASRKWELSDKLFLTYFDSIYPHKLPWQRCRPTKPVSSSVTSSLCPTKSRCGQSGCLQHHLDLVVQVLH
jgi:hypothetical protein